MLGQAGRAKRNNETTAHITLGSSADASRIRTLIATLGGFDGAARRDARVALVALGKPSVEPLINALLTDPSADARWEAAKALVELRDPTAMDALIRALEDDNFGVRWLAAEGLIALGRQALAPVLQALAERSSSVWLREGVHHVLRDLASRGFRHLVEPVLAALDGPEPVAAAPEEAEIALDQLSRTSKVVDEF